MAPQKFNNGLPPWASEDPDDSLPPSTIPIEVPVDPNLDTDGGPALVFLVETLVETPYYNAPTMPPSPLGPTPAPVPPVHQNQNQNSNHHGDWPKHTGSSTETEGFDHGPYDHTTSETTTFTTPLPSSTPSFSSTPFSLSSRTTASAGASQPTHSNADDFGFFEPHEKDVNNGHVPVYAAAAAVPVVVLAILGALVFVCMRRRKRRKLEAGSVGSKQAPEMKAQWKPTVQPYMAPLRPSRAVLPDYSPPTNYPASNSPASAPPIILGPIPSGVNGAYLTGIDTSDMVSVTSASVRDPFADGRSLEEPPPPYRPRSMAPSSIAPTSRQSSLRVAAAPPANSQTHLIERSPFEDPEFEEDNISELSGPTARQETDAMSSVSDLSYQHDPVVGRSSL